MDLEYEKIKELRKLALERDDNVCYFCKKKNNLNNLGITPKENHNENIWLEDVITTHLECNPKSYEIL